VIHTHLHDEKYVPEMEIPGKRTYFHGSPELTTLRELDCKYVGKHKCIFFTAHFGYALDLAFPIGWTPTYYLTLKKISNEILFKNPIHPKYDVGYIYPIMLQLWPKIIDWQRPQDVSNIADMLGRSVIGTHLNTKTAMLELMDHMLNHGWFSLDNKAVYSDCIFAGVSRDMVIEVLHKDPRILGFCCYDRKGEGTYGYPAIGVFQDKIKTDWISQHKPIRVKYTGERFNPHKDASEYVISIKNPNKR